MTKKRSIITHAATAITTAILTIALNQPIDRSSSVPDYCITPIVTPTRIPDPIITPTYHEPQGADFCSKFQTGATFVPYVTLRTRLAPTTGAAITGSIMAKSTVPVYCIAKFGDENIWLAISDKYDRWVAYYIKSLRPTPFGACILCPFLDN